MSLDKMAAEYLNKLESYWVCNETESRGYWRNEHLYPDAQMRGLNLGSGGIILALLALRPHLKSEPLKKLIEKRVRLAATWLIENGIDQKSHGFFTGNAGVALSIAAAGNFIGSTAMTQSAEEMLIYSLENVELSDFFSGSQGVLYAACIWLESFEKSSLSPQANRIHNLVLEKAKTLIKKIENSENVLGIRDANVDEGIEDIYSGVAHGSIGLYMVLKRLSHLIEDPSITELSEIIRLSILKYAQNSQKTSLRYRAGSPVLANNLNWCHGAAGLLWADLVSKTTATDCVSDWAIERVVSNRRYDNTTLCHGVAGRLNLLSELKRKGIDCKKDSLHSIDIELDHDLASLDILSQKKEGTLFWSSDDVFWATPDLWVGFSGTFLSFVNARFKLEIPMILSPDFFSYLSPPAQVHGVSTNAPTNS